MAAEFIGGHFAFGPYFGPYVCRTAVDLVGPYQATGGRSQQDATGNSSGGLLSEASWLGLFVDGQWREKAIPAGGSALRESSKGDLFFELFGRLLVFQNNHLSVREVVCEIAIERKLYALADVFVGFSVRDERGIH